MTVYSESFESGLGSWVNDPANVSDWIRDGFGTTSDSTGPSSAYDGSYYIYIETSSSGSISSGDTDIIEYDMGELQSGDVDFWFHQYGTDQGTLYLDAYDGTSWANLWSSTGDQGDVWNNQNVTFTNKTKIRFRNVAAGDIGGGGYTGDVALDLIIVSHFPPAISDGGTAAATGSADNLTSRDSDTGIAAATGSADNLTFRGTEGGAAGATGNAYNLTLRDSDGATPGASGSCNTYHNQTIGPDGAAAGAAGLANITATRTLPDGGAAAASGAILNYTEWKATHLEYAAERFYITLTGSEDGTTDIDIPISNFNARFQTGKPTYLTVTIPAFVDYATAVAARSNGQIILNAYYEWLGETLLTQEIMRVDLQNINTFEGANSKSIVLDGYKTQTPVGQTIDMDYLQYREIQGGTTTLRFPRIDFFLRPGDTLTAGDTTITVGAIQYTVTPKSRSMSVSE